MINLYPTLANIFPLPEAASNWAQPIDWVFWFITIVCAISFVLVEGLLFYFVFKYRRKKGEPDKKTPFITHSTKLEIVWTVVPTIIVLFIFYYGAVDYLNMRTIPKDALEIKITGKQWSWDFSYGDGHTYNTQNFCDGDSKKITPTDCEEAGKKWSLGDTMKIPVNKNIKLWITSTDVLHSFFIPAFRQKQDAVPGQFTYLWFKATKPGVYDIFCTEYCGKDHWGMLGKIEVVSEEAYLAWRKGEKVRIANLENRDLTDEERAKIGAELFQKKGCIACHDLKGQRLVGPPLNNLIGRKEKLTNGKTIVVNEEYIRESIMDPAAKVVATYPPMAPQAVSKDEVKSFIAYFKTLK